MIYRLEADSIQLDFSGRSILTDVYLKCETGSITGLLARNGQGKTCLLNIIYGTTEAKNKSIRFDNVSIHEAFKKPGLLRYLPQFNFIPGSLSLERIFSDFELSYLDFENYFPEFKSRHNFRIRNLSGGQRRLAEVYIIIKSKSQFAMLDEPFSHLEPFQIEKIKDILLSEKENKGFVITDHMYRQILDVCDNLYILADGKTHLTKNTKEIEALGYTKFNN